MATGREDAEVDVGVDVVVEVVVEQVPAVVTTAHYGTKPGDFKTSNHFPTNEGAK